MQPAARGFVLLVFAAAFAGRLPPAAAQEISGLQAAVALEQALIKAIERSEKSVGCRILRIGSM